MKKYLTPEQKKEIKEKLRNELQRQAKVWIEEKMKEFDAE